MRDTPKAKLAMYLACTFGLSAVFYGIIISIGFGAYGGLAVFGLMWCPAVGAVVARLFTQGNLRGMGWGLGGQGLGSLKKGRSAVGHDHPAFMFLGRFPL